MIEFGISGMDDKQDLHRGRPRGGVAACVCSQVKVLTRWIHNG